ncbi:hypothetical protein CVT24_008947 [Panaeolus cyanescens]|uniref:GYF domain-containing protein n=1 Tax=Panaeolus cyanescens TaxID=181874 RepID=A0A409WCF4_9AGAR|nr:hypothetical protein CVT24_008947 [Panaeolus cyanescens]
MPPKTGQKRSATQADEIPVSTTKKTRFVEPTDDPINFAEQVDSALEGPSRRGKIKTDGYDSDSTDDGEGVVESRKKSGKEDDDDLDDMFASGDKEEKEETDGKKKEEKFMRLADIEGQEFGNESGSEEDTDDDEPEDEDDAERRKKAGMGYEMSSFNMREEMEEGKFTEDGMYVRSFDPHGVHDRWMEGLDEKEIKQARRRKKEQEKKQKERMLAEEKELEENGGKSNLEQKLLVRLKKGETVLEALQRLGSTKKRNKKSKSQDATVMNVDKEPTEIEIITDLASRLMSLGDTDIYSKTFEEIVRSVRSSGHVPPSWEPVSADIKYEYKWRNTEAGSTDETFGPFSEEDIKSWFNASYFGTSGEKIQVRKVGQEWGDWDDVVV